MLGTFAVRALSSVLIVLSAAALPSITVARAGITLRDDLQREVSIARPAQRIITMLPSLTEAVCALGACDRLVATDRYSNWPAAVGALPKAGGLDDASIELIVSLKPDLVLISSAQRVSARLDELGVASFALNPQSYADGLRTVDLIGQLLGIPERAAALNALTEQRVREVGEASIRRRHGASPSVYFEIDRTPYVAGPQSYIGELLARLGVRNIVTADMGNFPRVNPEYVVRHDPDIMFVERADVAGLAMRPGWGRLRAVREGHICAFPADVDATIMRPGPRVADGMQAMADCIERFTQAAPVKP
ncbi:MAG: ABC transporter substrate-binding protein [Steroidobacterales bacterium]